MAVTKRSVKGSALTTAEMDANWDELIGLLTRLSTYVADTTPEASQIPLLDASGILRVGSYIVARPAVTNSGPKLGDRSRYNTMVEASNYVYLCSNCYYDGTNWRSIAAGACYTLFIGTSGPKIATATATGAGEALTMTSSDLMTVPAAAAWQTPTLLNSWAGYNAGFPVRYCKDGMNIVRLKGLISGGTPGANAVFTLPSGYRPASAFTCASFANVSGSYSIARIQVATDGNVTVVSPAAVTYVALDNIAFTTY